MPTANVVNITVVNNLPGAVNLGTASPACPELGSWGSNGSPNAVIAGAGGTWSGTMTALGSGETANCFAYTYLSPLGAMTTFQFAFGCGSKNTAQVTAMTLPPGGATAVNDYSYAVPFVTSVGGGSSSFCKIAQSGSPFNVTFFLCNRITEVKAAPTTVPVLNWEGNPIPTAPIWMPGVNYSDGNGGSTNPLLFYSPPSTQGPKFLCLCAMVMCDQTTLEQGNNQNNQVTLHAPMMELVSKTQMMFQSDSTTLNPTFTQTSVSACPVNLYCAQPSNYTGVACISSFVTGAANWVMATDTVVGAPQVELYWPLGPACAMWTGEGGPGGVWVRTLRDIFRALALANNPSVATSPWGAITKNCFQSSPINSPNGPKFYQEMAAQYGGGTNVFNLVGYYTAAKDNYVNCADQAGFVQVCLGAIGVGSQTLALEPVGFLNTTYLVGNPYLQCNNPNYWEVYGTTAAALTAPNQLPGALASTPPYGRLWWQDHVVVQLVATPTQPLTPVLDATLGPYVASSFSQYLTLAIDTSSGAQQLYKHWNTAPRPTIPSYWVPPIDVGTYTSNGCYPNTGQSGQCTPGSGIANVTVIAPPSSSA